MANLTSAATSAEIEQIRMGVITRYKRVRIINAYGLVALVVFAITAIYQLGCPLPLGMQAALWVSISLSGTSLLLAEYRKSFGLEDCSVATIDELMQLAGYMELKEIALYVHDVRNRLRRDLTVREVNLLIALGKQYGK